MSDRFKAPKPPKNVEGSNIAQFEKFRDAAREAETDDDEKRFDERLKKIVKQRPKGDSDK